MLKSTSIFRATAIRVGGDAYYLTKDSTNRYMWERDGKQIGGCYATKSEARCDIGSYRPDCVAYFREVAA